MVDSGGSEREELECYAMLCYAMLCYAMLCYAMLCYAKISYSQSIRSNVTFFCVIRCNWFRKNHTSSPIHSRPLYKTETLL